MAKQKIRLRPEIKERISIGAPEEKEVTARLAIHFKCTQGNVRKLIKSDSDKLVSEGKNGYAVKIKELLKLNPKTDISESYEQT